MNGKDRLVARLAKYTAVTGRCWFEDNKTSMVAREVKAALEGGPAPKDPCSYYRIAMAIADDLAKKGIYE